MKSQNTKYSALRFSQQSHFRMCRAWLRASVLVGLILGSVHWNVHSAQADEPPKPRRVTQGLQSFYDLRTLAADEAKDQAGGLTPLPMQLKNPGAAKAGPVGLTIQGNTLLASRQTASGLTAAIQRSGAMSVEVWMRPGSTSQSGPARIVTLSKNGSERNFTLGQDGDRLEFRLRTSSTNDNGVPGLASQSGVVQTELMHVVCTHSRSGITRIFVNGGQVAEQKLSGDFSNWNSNYHLGLANEFSGDRPWLGTIALVAIFGRDLSAEEIQQNFAAGVGNAMESLEPTPAELNARLFETQVAPILARHCLECHDTANQLGALDLSRREPALRGGESGLAFVAGHSTESRLWHSVASDEMPADRNPLSAEEKELLKRWLDGGAEWSLPTIDPANYVHGAGSQSVFVQRLTVPEYAETVRSILGIDVLELARETMPADLRADGFSNTAYNLTVDLAHIEGFAKMAESITQRLDVASIAKKHTKSRELSDENFEKFIIPFGRLMLRGPISEEEKQIFLGVSTSVAAGGGDFDDAVRHIIAAMLQSPRFVYRMELQRGDGTAWPVNTYELASRLSFILWGGPPDESLLAAADKAKLSGDALQAQVERMLSDERAVRRSKQFVSEWLNIDHLRNLQPDAQRFPQWNGQLAEDMQAETLAYFEEIVWTQNRPLADLLNAQVTLATPRLADYYGLSQTTARAANETTANEATANAVTLSGGDGALMRYDLSQVAERGGLLTQGSTLSIGGDDASMVTRGLFVMHELLRGAVKDPPPCVNTTPIPSQPGLTQRAIAEERLRNSSCQGCHAKFEPLSFGLEKFDGLGGFREFDEHGNALREDGKVLFPGDAEPIDYETSAELMNLLAQSERVKESITWKVSQFALGRPLGAEDARTLAEIHNTAQAAGGRWSDVMKAIVLSDLVQTIRTEAGEKR
jgi:hypothetical protein